MRRTFPLHDLSNDEFESLVIAICFHVLGTGTIVFATGKDGGRDAAFAGAATKFPSVQSPLTGKFIVQAKHTGNPVASCSDKEFEGILKDEHPKIAKLENAPFYHFVYHDGIFEGFSNGMKLRMLELIREIIKDNKIQYIFSIIDADLPRTEDGQSTISFDPREIVLELNDQGDEGRLFKMPPF